MWARVTNVKRNINFIAAALITNKSNTSSQKCESFWLKLLTVNGDCWICGSDASLISKEFWLGLKLVRKACSLFFKLVSILQGKIQGQCLINKLWAINVDWGVLPTKNQLVIEKERKNGLKRKRKTNWLSWSGPVGYPWIDNSKCRSAVLTLGL